MPGVSRTTTRCCPQKILVFPQLKTFGTADGSAQVVAADHFSFLVNPKAPETRRLQFHRTRYNPVDGMEPQDAHLGTIERVPNHWPLAFHLPRDVPTFKQTFVRAAALKADAALIHNVLLRPLLEGGGSNAAAPDGNAAATGGGRKGTRTSAAYKRLKRRLRDQPIARFEDVWTSLPLHELHVMVVPHADGPRPRPSGSPERDRVRTGAAVHVGHVRKLSV